MPKSVAEWMNAHPAAAECARDWIGEGLSYAATVEHLQNRHGFPFTHPGALAKWGRSKGHYRGKYLQVAV